MSTSAALLILLGGWGGVTGDSIHALERFDRAVLVLELLVIGALIVSLGRVAMVWLNGWGVLLVAMVLGGIASPLVIGVRSSARGALAPVLVLAGGLVLRAVIIFSSDGLR